MTTRFAGARWRAIPGTVTGIARQRAPTFLILGFLLSAAGASAAADLVARVVILANSRQPESVALAEHYAAMREVPRENIIALPVPEDETITWRQYVDQVHQPLQDELFRRKWIDAAPSELLDPLGRRRATIHGHRISFLVVCRGVPLRIHHDPTIAEPRVRVPGRQFETNQAAVDAELALLAHANPPAVGFVANPLFARDRPSDLQLRQVVRVARLDGPNWEDARQLVESALIAERVGAEGRYYVDLKGPHPDGDKWLQGAVRLLDAAGFDGDVESTAGLFAAGARFEAPLWYFGWYTGELNGPFGREGFRFPPGAVALHIHSFSAATLRSRDHGWTGPLVARGVTATVGNVFEPYLQLTHRPDLLAKALLEGRTFGEAAYESLPVLGWQAIAVGDPLYRRVAANPMAGLPAAVRSHAAIRMARLEAAKGNAQAARARLEREMSDAPTLSLMLFLARWQARDGEPARAAATLGAAALLPQHRGDQWPLAREIARELAKLGRADLALQLFVALADSPAPTPEAGKELLEEARKLADTSGDPARLREIVRRLNAAEN